MPVSRLGWFWRHGRVSWSMRFRTASTKRKASKALRNPAAGVSADGRVEREKVMQGCDGQRRRRNLPAPRARPIPPAQPSCVLADARMSALVKASARARLQGRGTAARIPFHARGVAPPTICGRCRVNHGHVHRREDERGQLAQCLRLLARHPRGPQMVGPVGDSVADRRVGSEPASTGSAHSVLHSRVHQRFRGSPRIAAPSAPGAPADGSVAARTRARLCPAAAFEQAVVGPLPGERHGRRDCERAMGGSGQARLERAEEAGRGRGVARAVGALRAPAPRTARSQSARAARPAAARTPRGPIRQRLLQQRLDAGRQVAPSPEASLRAGRPSPPSRADHDPGPRPAGLGESRRSSAARRASVVPSSQTRLRSPATPAATPSINQRHCGLCPASHRPRSPATLVAAGSSPGARSWPARGAPAAADEGRAYRFVPAPRRGSPCSGSRRDRRRSPPARRARRPRLPALPPGARAPSAGTNPARARTA